MRSQLQTNPGPILHNPLLKRGVLQRKCTCGQHSSGGAACDTCANKTNGMLRRSSRGAEHLGGVSLVVGDVLGASGQAPDTATHGFEPRFGYDFSDVRVHTGGGADESARARFEPNLAHDFSRVPLNSRSHSSDGWEDDESQESINLPIPRTSPPPPSVPTPPLPGAAPTCPTSTRVDETTDLTLAGLQAGFLSAYGIIARMRVLPEATNWDGKQITEALVQTSSTCPAGLTQPGPCAGDSTFTVGAASGGSNIIPVQPAVPNRFYDFHTTRSRRISFLHDPTRNPAGLNSCETVCQQIYSCNGVPIGMHTVTRRFSKSSFNGRNVTIVNITKEDPISGPGDFPQQTLPPGDEYA